MCILSPHAEEGGGEFGTGSFPHHNLPVAALIGKALVNELMRGGLHWAHEGRKALWVQSSRPKMISAFTKLKHENRLDEAVIFWFGKCKASLERVALMWVLKEESKTRKRWLFHPDTLHPSLTLC